MSADHRREGRSSGINFELSDVVQDVQEDAALLDHRGFRDVWKVRSGIAVSQHCRDGSDRLQLLKDGRIANVTRMDEVIATRQGGRCLRPQRTVSIGDQSNSNHDTCMLTSAYFACKPGANLAVRRAEFSKFGPRQVQSSLALAAGLAQIIS